MRKYIKESAGKHKIATSSTYADGSNQGKIVEALCIGIPTLIFLKIWFFMSFNVGTLDGF